VLDTAPAYGRAEREIGGLSAASTGFALSQRRCLSRSRCWTRDHARQITERFMRSLDFLCMPSIHGLLVHHADLVLRPGAEHVVEALHSLRDQRLVTKIGISVYDGRRDRRGLRRLAFDLVQVPLSIADQRLLRSGHLARLKRRGVEIHARSVFSRGCS